MLENQQTVRHFWASCEVTDVDALGQTSPRTYMTSLDVDHNLT